MKTARCTVLAATALLLAACGGSHDKAPTAATAAASRGVLQMPLTGPSVETINGVAVPQSLLEAVAKGRGLDLSKPADRTRALDELQQYILLAQQADALQLDQHPDLVANMEAARLQGVANAVLEAYGQSHPVTDEQVAKEYHEQVSRLGDKTYQITLLEFADEATANQAAAELKSGKSFDKVFDAFRTKAKVAQSLPAAFLQQMPGELATAVAGLQAGHATTTPIRGTAGWDLVYLNQINAFAPPALDKVSTRLRAMLQQQQADAYIESLKVNAKIELAAPARVASIAPDAARPSVAGKAVSKHVVNDAAPAATSAGH